MPDNHQSVGYVFGETVNNSGFSGSGFSSIVFWYVFGIGLLMSQYTMTGYDASAHMAEETHQASRTRRRRDVDVRVRVDGLRVDSASRRHLRDPGHARV